MKPESGTGDGVYPLQEIAWKVRAEHIQMGVVGGQGDIRGGTVLWSSTHATKIARLRTIMYLQVQNPFDVISTLPDSPTH